jgi:hypothetical protein
MIDWTKFPPPILPREIFKMKSDAKIEHELGNHCFMKKIRFSQNLTDTEAIFDCMKHIGSNIMGDGFLSLFHEIFTPEDFKKVCDAFTEVGGLKLRDLLCEAWGIYTKGKSFISAEELRAIPVRRFNTKEMMDRFDQIGDEVVAELQAQYPNNKVWSVEYAKLHRGEFKPIEK